MPIGSDAELSGVEISLNPMALVGLKQFRVNSPPQQLKSHLCHPGAKACEAHSVGSLGDTAKRPIDPHHEGIAGKVDKDFALVRLKLPCDVL